MALVLFAPNQTNRTKLLKYNHKNLFWFYSKNQNQNTMMLAVSTNSISYMCLAQFTVVTYAQLINYKLTLFLMVQGGIVPTLFKGG